MKHRCCTRHTTRSCWSPTRTCGNSANVQCWPVEEKFERKLQQALSEHFGVAIRRAHPIKPERGHGFISSQREGSDLFATIDPDAPVIVLLTAWQYSHHLAASLVHHRGPILLLANFDGTWPGLVGMLCMAGTLTSLSRYCARLWSENFDDPFFLNGLREWLETGRIEHDTSYLHRIDHGHSVMATPAAQIGRQVGKYVLHHKEIIGLFDTFCMGMINGVFPQKALCDIGMPLEGLSQSALLVEMAKVPVALRQECLDWYQARGMSFMFGSDPATALVEAQVLEQCAMLIALARFAQRFGLSAIGVQYQQGLAGSCAASDFAEGALGSAERFPIPDETGAIIRPGKPIPCINEVDMGSAIPQTMLWRLLDALGLPSATTLHDVRWGSEFEGRFYWDLEISGRYRSSTFVEASLAPLAIGSRRCTSRKVARRSQANARRAVSSGRAQTTWGPMCICILAPAMRLNCRRPNSSVAAAPLRMSGR